MTLKVVGCDVPSLPSRPAHRTPPTDEWTQDRFDHVPDVQLLHPVFDPQVDGVLVPWRSQEEVVQELHHRVPPAHPGGRRHE